MNNNLLDNNSFIFEIKRKLFHISGIVIPIIYLNYVPKNNAIIILFIIAAVTLIMDYIRHKNNHYCMMINNIFLNIMREEEKKCKNHWKFSGASNMAIGLFFSALFFSKEITIISWYILFISDSISAIVGIQIGRIKIPYSCGKSLEGTLAFFLSSIIIILFFNKYFNHNIHYIAILVISFTVTIFELYSKRYNIDDNLSIPLSCGVTYSFLQILY